MTDGSASPTPAAPATPAAGAPGTALPPVREVAATPSRLQAGLLKALSSDWGLRILALVLALLVWGVVRQEITTQQWIFVDVIPKARSPERFDAFQISRIPGERIQILLAGPQGEIDDARDLLGERPTIDVRVDDLPAGQDRADVSVQWRRDEERYVFRFPRRLVQQIPEIRIRVFRRIEQRARIPAPALRGIPPGWEARDLKVDPPEVTSLGPAGMLGELLTPDPVDLTAAFAEQRATKAPLSLDLFFNEWRNDETAAAFRGGFALPKATCTVRFVASATKRIENALLVAYAGAGGDDASDYDWAIDAGVPDLAVDQRRFTGEFRGGSADLAFIEEHRGEWTYAVQIPLEEMAAFRAGDQTTLTLRAPLVWLPSTEALRRLLVEFVPPATHPAVVITVTKR